MSLAAHGDVFAAAPTALLVLDYTAVLAEFGRLRDDGVDDVGDSVRADPQLAARCVQQIAITAANFEAAAVLGADVPEQLVGGLQRILAPATVPTFAEQIAALADGNLTHEADAILQRLDGSPIEVLLRVAVSGMPGNFAEVVASVTDITWRRRLEQEQRSQANFVDAILENMPDALFVKRAEKLDVVRCNRAAEALLGRPRQELYGQDVWQLYPSDRAEASAARDREALAVGAPIEVVEEPVEAAAGRRWLHTQRVPLYNDSGEPAFLLAIAQDVTELRRVRADLVRSNRDLEAFAYSASHDLKEPLRTINTFVGLLMDELGDQSAGQVGQITGFITSACDRMTRRIDGLLALSQAGQERHPRTSVSLSQLHDEVVESLATTIAESSAAITRDELPIVRCESPLIGQVLQNLLVNALKFRGEQPPRVHVSGGRVEGGWRISVRDNGMGFDQRNAEHIFGIFKRLHRDDAYPGSGIGLALCRRIVEDHGGVIEAESSPGQGATFRFLLPD